MALSIKPFLKKWMRVKYSVSTNSANLFYRGQDVSAFQPSADLILVADCIYYEEVRKLLSYY